MIEPPKSTGKDPTLSRKSISDWLSGVVDYDDVRTPVKGLKAAGNVLLEQNGTVRPRPSLKRYGPQPLGKVLGEIYEFKKVTNLTTETWMISMQSFGVSTSPSASLSPSTSMSPSASYSLSPSLSSSLSLSPSASSSLSQSPSSSISVSDSASISPSSSASPSASTSTSPSASNSPSASVSPSSSDSPSQSPSASVSSSVSPSSSISASVSPSASRSPSASASASYSPSASRSPSASVSPSASTSQSPSASQSPSTSISASPSYPVTAGAQIFVARGEDANWTAVTGKFYDETARVHFVQVGGSVLIMNGVDNLSYYDIDSGVVVPYTALSTPTAPTLTTDNVGGSGFNITYRISANSTVGETAASNALTVDVDTPRDQWNPPSNGGTDNVIIAWAAVDGAASYNVYCGTVSGYEFLIAANINGLAFTDDGSFVQQTQRLYPTTDSTGGPKTSRGSNINGRVFMCGDSDNPYRIWYGGDPGFELDFSPANGGGYTPIGEGSKDLPTNVKQYRDGKGTPQITVFCEGTNGGGKRFLMTPDQLTYGNSIYTFYAVSEDSNGLGTNSPDAIVPYGTDLHYPTRDGFQTTGTQPTVQNLLSTKRTSNTIQESMKLLNNNAMANAVGIAFEGRVYFALPVSSSTNSEIWVLDLERKGAWMKPWSIAADWMWLYNDNDGTTHFMVLSNNVIYEMTYANLTADDGVAFPTLGTSGQVYFSDDKRMWVQLLAVVILMAGPQGTISFEITGKTEDDDIITLGEPYTFNPEVTTQVAGWGEPNKYVPGWGQNDWSQVGEVPTTENQSTQEVIIEIDEEVQWAAYSWSSAGVGVDYNISDVTFIYTETGIKDVS